MYLAHLAQFSEINENRQMQTSDYNSKNNTAELLAFLSNFSISLEKSGMRFFLRFIVIRK